MPLPKVPLTSASAAHQRRKECRRGFTLIELVIALAMLGTLASIAIPRYANYLEKAKISRAMADIHALGTDIRLYVLSSGELPDTLAEVGRKNFLDPWQNPYEYLEIGCDQITAMGKLDRGKRKTGKCQPPSGARKDRFLVPLNSDFDLYSKGKDGASVAPLPAKSSWDDVVRANDGGYVGLGSAF